jgi:hypothetical protein
MQLAAPAIPQLRALPYKQYIQWAKLVVLGIFVYLTVSSHNSSHKIIYVQYFFSGNKNTLILPVIS